jgi:iron complex outermembrane receptor protein
MNAVKGRFSAGTLLAAASTFALGAVTSAPAVAQENLANIDVVTVTARKQAESLQTVPVTVTAVGSQAIERFNYDKVADIVSRIPTLNVQVGGSGSGGQLSLRGIGSSNISAAFDSAVAFDFDGVQVATMRIVQSAFFDMQQIEVLKGPQSLFFGKSASGGVISLKSKGATEELEFGGKLSYEIEERGLTTEAYVSGPLSDKAGFRLAARYNNISRLYYAEGPNSDPKKGEENINLRATFEVDPTDTFSANLKLI